MGEHSTQADRGGRWFHYAKAEWSVVKGDAFAKLPTAARAVWLVLHAHADADSLTCDPSLRTIGKLAGLNPQHATRHLAALEEAGLVERRRSAGGRARTVYRLIVPPVAPAQQQADHRRNSSGGAGATPPVAPAQRQPSRRRNTNHDHQNLRQQTQSIEPGDGALRHGSGGLGHVEEADLNDTSRLIELYSGWRGCMPPTQIDPELLNFVAAAIHAAKVTPNGKPIKSRPALFASMVRKEDWAKVTQTEEDEANRRLKAHLHGMSAEPRQEPYDPQG